MKRAIQIDPSIAEAHATLGACYFLQGDFRQAEKALRKAIDLYPENEQTMQYRAQAHFNLGQTLLQIERKQEAKTEFETVRRLVPDYSGIDEALKFVSE